MEIGKMTISQAMPYLKSIASSYGLRLNRAKEFKFARLILANLYSRELC
jgi:5-methylthioribose kinase